MCHMHVACGEMKPRPFNNLQIPLPTGGRIPRDHPIGPSTDCLLVCGSGEESSGERGPGDGAYSEMLEGGLASG
jgi:hypothetical protein